MGLETGPVGVEKMGPGEWGESDSLVDSQLSNAGAKKSFLDNNPKPSDVATLESRVVTDENGNFGYEYRWNSGNEG